MKKNLGIILIVIVLVLLAIFFFAGGKNNNGSEEQKESATDEMNEMMNGEDGDAMMEEDSMMEGDHMEDSMMEEADVTVELSGKNFEFSQDEIRVSEGDVVKIVFTSESGFHDWRVDEFDAATKQVQTGETSEVTFVADKAGEYEYYCSVGQHRANGMVGTLIVK